MNQETRPPQEATIIRFPGRSSAQPVQGTACDAQWRELIQAVREGSRRRKTIRWMSGIAEPSLMNTPSGLGLDSIGHDGTESA